VGCPPKRALVRGSSRPRQYNLCPKDSQVSNCFQVTTTLPSEAAAQQIAAKLVEERLAACGQVLGPVLSIYRWKGSIEQAAEWYCNLKTTKTRLPALTKRIQELHPYELPEIVAVPIQHGNAAYLEWIEAEVELPAGSR
jgi:periplasmic divalent cation tolerance protein